MKVDLQSAASESEYTRCARVAIILATLAIVATTTPVMSQSNSKIAFQTNRDGNNEVYSMDDDGSNQTNLTNCDEREGKEEPCSDQRPSICPTTRKIVFDSDRDGTSLLVNDIFIMGPDGSSQTNLTSTSSANEYDAHCGAGSSGPMVVFVDASIGNGEIYSMETDGSNKTRLTNNSDIDIEPAWCGDTKTIVFASDRDGNYEIYIMDENGSSQTRLTNNSVDDRSPSCSPDGETVSFHRWVGTGDADVFTMDSDGSNQVNLTDDDDSAERDPDWSPAGTMITFSSTEDGDFEVYKMTDQGSSITQLTTNSGITDAIPNWGEVPEP